MKDTRKQSLFKRIYYFLSYDSIVFFLLSFVWFLLRTGTKPSRIVYPCQRVALAQMATLSRFALIGCIVAFLKAVYSKVKRNLLRTAGVCVVVASIVLCAHYSVAYARKVKMEKLARHFIPAPSDSFMEQAQAAYTIPEGVGYVNPEDAVVSFAYDDSVLYGETAPYDKEDNPAYALVWRAVEQLGYGTHENPLRDFIGPSDKVLIKPNLVSDFSRLADTHPAVVRPLIDMAIAAGAQIIWVGDGSTSKSKTDYILDFMNYTAMVDILQARHPGIEIRTVNLNDLSNGWHWVNIGSYSSFAGSPYNDSHLDNSGSSYHHTTDPQGVNPQGHVMGWHAINDYTLDATVIINVPKLKCHSFINTISIKNHVGTSIVLPGASYGARIVHGIRDGDYYFENDGFWRDIHDVHKIILYTDAEGNICSSQQRRQLNVVDAIIGMRGSTTGSCHQNGPPADSRVIIASADSIATDAVASRIMGYNFNVIPPIHHAHEELLHPIGTNDPERIRVIGDDIGVQHSFVYDFCYEWRSQAAQYNLGITDFAPPAITAVDITYDADEIQVTATISDALTAYVYYGDAYVKMDDAGGPDDFEAVLPKDDMVFHIITQDEWFNTLHSMTYRLGACAVDFNKNGVVDGADYTIWADNFQKENPSWEDGDANYDGAVDGTDYTIWADNYEKTCPAVGATAAKRVTDEPAADQLDAPSDDDLDPVGAPRREAEDGNGRRGLKDQYPCPPKTRRGRLLRSGEVFGTERDEPNRREGVRPRADRP